MTRGFHWLKLKENCTWKWGRNKMKGKVDIVWWESIKRNKIRCTCISKACHQSWFKPRHKWSHLSFTLNMTRPADSKCIKTHQQSKSFRSRLLFSCPQFLHCLRWLCKVCHALFEVVCKVFHALFDMAKVFCTLLEMVMLSTLCFAGGGEKRSWLLLLVF